MGTLSSLSGQRVAADESEVGELARSFPPGFLFGTATSSYQIEGATTEDGRGVSIWDTFSAVPGNTFDDADGSVACDHYHRYRDDVQLMSELGMDAYRFSIAWPRVVPDGLGPVNSQGLDFYDRLVDQLLDRDIQPFATLYHWDLPQALEDRGGWYSRETADAFETYTRAVVERLGDRVQRWISINEPWVSAWIGYGEGRHAPGKVDGAQGAIRSAHYLLLAHGKAVNAIREISPKSRVGITLNLSPAYPASSDAADERAARLNDVTANRWFLDPVFRGTYPIDIPQYLEYLPEGASSDLPTISTPIDFLGINYYSRSVVTLDPDTQMPVGVAVPNVERTDSGWEIYPQGLADLLRRLTEEYRIPSVYITENGAAYADGPGPNGAVADSRRTKYLEKHFRAAAGAMAAGARLDGYFVWSLLDNFEWASAYDNKTRFGIVYVDYETQERVPKQSAGWYRDVIAAHHAQD